MSLINDALKKTQRMRSDPNDSSAAVVGGRYAGPRGRSNSGPSVGLMIGGGALLVAIAIGGTILLLKSKSSPTAAAAAAPIAAPVNVVAAPPTVAPSPVATTTNPGTPALVAAPVIVLPKMELAPTPAASTATAATTSAAPELTAAPLSPTAAPVGNPAAKAKVDVATFIDAIHVTGVRFSEGSSKVLMNDHVYKVNDVVERVLNIKLVEVGTDSLTFVDENGAIYKKGF